MANEIATINRQLVKTIEKNGISDIIKPLVKEVEMQDTYVSGTLLIDKTIYQKLKIGDELTLKRDMKNKFDDFAVEIDTKEGKRIGFIQEEYSKIYANLIEAGKLIIGKIKRMNLKKDPYEIVITTYLKDF